MHWEGAAEKEAEEQSKKGGVEADTEENKGELPREWVIENFQLQDNPIIKTTPKLVRS